MKVRRLLLLVALLGAAGACGDAEGISGQTRVGDQLLDTPPALTLLTPSGDVELPTWSYCTQQEAGEVSVGGCAGGGPPRRPPRLQSDGTAAFRFPHDDWTFVAEFRPAAERKEPACRPRWSAPVSREGDRYVIPALGPAGAWDVDVSGHSTTELGNDMVTTFRWVTSTDSDIPIPAWAQIGFHNPPLDGVRKGAYGPSVRLEGLSPEPTTATGTFTVTADGGESESFELESDEDDCAADGLVTLGYGLASEERDIDGDTPFTYRLEVVLDQTTYVGTATWPDDGESPGSSEVLVNDWEPPLPDSAYRRFADQADGD